MYHDIIIHSKGEAKCTTNQLSYKAHFYEQNKTGSAAATQFLFHSSYLLVKASIRNYAN